MTKNIELVLSHSQVQVYNRCQYKWYLQYVEGWRPKKMNEAASKGIFIHELLQLWYEHHEKQKLVDFAHSKLRASTSADELDLYSSSLNLVTRYINEFAPANDSFEVLGQEQHFQVQLFTPKRRTVGIQGFVDLIVRKGPNIFTLDHKTINSKFWSEMEVELDSQQPLYGALLPFTDGPWKDVPINGIMINMLNRYQYKSGPPEKDKLFRRISSYRSDIQKKNIVKEFVVLADRILDHLEEPNPHYAKNLTRDCKSCSFSDACLYSLKGVQPEPFLMQTHEKTSNPLANQMKALDDND